MVSLEELAALDLQIWLRTGKDAALASRCNQSTIYRRVERTLKGFGLGLRRCEGEWLLKGNPLLITMERELHQLARFLGQEPLRLEVGPLMAPLAGGRPRPSPRGGAGGVAPADWEGRTADGVALTYANPFNLALHPRLPELEPLA